MNFLDETHFERQRQISLNLESFLAKLESQTSSFKNDIQRKLANQFNELFRKKDFDECIQNIRNRGLEEWFKGGSCENDHQNLNFTRIFLEVNIELLRKKDRFISLEFSLNDAKEIVNFLIEMNNYYLKSKKMISREMWNEKKDEILLNIMKKKYPELTKTNSSNSIFRIKWKDICSEFQRECHRILKQSNLILGKHCRERWINHLDPNMKRGNWSLEEDIQLLMNVLQYKRRWCMISSEVKNRSQHSLKNRFFHLMAINLGITNKACLKKKNFSNEILKIIEKYRQILKKDLTKDKIKQEVKEASKEESQNLTENYNNSSKINFEIIEPKSKIENSNIQESFTMKGQESQTNINNLINMNNNYMNPIISNNFNVNFLNTIPFWNPLINQNFPSMYNIGNGFNGSNNFNGFNGFGLNGFLDPKMMLMTNPYLQNNFFLNYKKY